MTSVSEVLFPELLFLLMRVVITVIRVDFLMLSIPRLGQESPSILPSFFHVNL
jgi:hypothetical protein